MQRPGAGAAHQEGVAELGRAGGWIGKIPERAVEGFDAGGGAGIDHLAEGVVPQVLLVRRARLVAVGIGENLVVRMAAADARRLHGA